MAARKSIRGFVAKQFRSGRSQLSRKWERNQDGDDDAKCLLSYSILSDVYAMHGHLNDGNLFLIGIAIGCGAFNSGQGKYGSLQTTADITSNRAVTLGSNGGSFDTDGHILALDGIVSGAGSLTKTGNGSLILNAANMYTGGTTVSAGTFEVGDSSHSSWVRLQSIRMARCAATALSTAMSPAMEWSGRAAAWEH
jgi:autotransporter-associated beta strand protein